MMLAAEIVIQLCHVVVAVSSGGNVGEEVADGAGEGADRSRPERGKQRARKRALGDVVFGEESLCALDPGGGRLGSQGR